MRDVHFVDRLISLGRDCTPGKYARILGLHDAVEHEFS